MEVSKQDNEIIDIQEIKYFGGLWNRKQNENLFSLKKGVHYLKTVKAYTTMILVIIYFIILSLYIFCVTMCFCYIKLKYMYSIILLSLIHI